MKILYGIVGEGMGHATRSRVVLEHLLSQGHEIHVVVSGRAHTMIVDSFKGRDKISIDEIHGFSFDYNGNQVSLAKTLWKNVVTHGPKGLLKNIRVYRRLEKEGYRPDLVISDFESWAYYYAKNHRLPVICIDNMTVMNRCKHDDYVTADNCSGFRFTRALVKSKLPGSYHYLTTSFFYPPVQKARTSLLPPILRPEILAAKREEGEHVLVYPSAAMPMDKLLPILKKLPYTFKVYGRGLEGVQGNVILRPFSQEGFIEDLRTAKAVLAGGGFSLMSETVHLRIPMLAIPIESQYEQELNVRYLQRLGYGEWTRELSLEVLQKFLQRLPKYNKALANYKPQSNEMLFRCLDELIHKIGLNEPAPDQLECPTMGKFFAPPLPDEVLATQGFPAFQ